MSQRTAALSFSHVPVITLYPVVIAELTHRCAGPGQWTWSDTEHRLPEEKAHAKTPLSMPETTSKPKT